MDLRKVLFIGGNSELAAVRIRCLDIATRLGCDFVIAEQLVEQIPDWYAAFVCVKSTLKASEIHLLAQRGPVIWDIIDELPPKENIALYLASNTFTKYLFEDYGRIELIPHHHCNFEGQPNRLGNKRPAWIGSRHWLPAMQGFDYDTYLVDGKSREDVVRAFRQTGIGLNFRDEAAIQHRVLKNITPAKRNEHKRVAKNLRDFHIAINSGIKLINCIGFGLPSVSSDEPAYHEFGADCTIFSNLKDCAKGVRALQKDNDLYLDLRKKCLGKAKQFHIDTIAEKYKKMLQAL